MLALRQDIRWVEGQIERQMEGQTHSRTAEGHFYSSPPPKSGDKNHTLNGQGKTECNQLFLDRMISVAINRSLNNQPRS